MIMRREKQCRRRTGHHHRVTDNILNERKDGIHKAQTVSDINHTGHVTTWMMTKPVFPPATFAQGRSSPRQGRVSKQITPNCKDNNSNGGLSLAAGISLVDRACLCPKPSVSMHAIQLSVGAKLAIEQGDVGCLQTPEEVAPNQSREK